MFYVKEQTMSIEIFWYNSPGVELILPQHEVMIKEDNLIDHYYGLPFSMDASYRIPILNLHIKITN